MKRRTTAEVSVAVVLLISVVLLIYSRPETTNVVACVSTIYVSFGGSAGSGSSVQAYTTTTNATNTVGFVTEIQTTPITTGGLEHSDITCTFISK